jgi:glycosyltransferase involved in cell wall biosynthesis
VKVAYIATSDVAIRYLLLDQLLYLKDRGYDVRAISGDGPHVAFVRAAGIPHTTLPLTRRISPLQDIRTFGLLVWHLLRLRPEVVHTQTPKAALLGQWAARVAGIPRRVHTIFGLYLPVRATGLRRRMLLVLERLQMAPAHLLLSQNAEDIATCEHEHLCDPSRLRLLGNGIDIDRFHPRNATPERVAAARQRLGIPPGRRVVGIVARLVLEKGYAELFAAIPRVLAAAPETVFIAIGGVEPDKSDRIAPDDPRIVALGEALRLLGHRDDVEELYPAMDVFVLPSHREGFPRSPLEAAATGIPVVVTDIRGCRETVIDGRTGLLVPLGDVDALAGAIASLLTDDERRREMGRNARTLAEERFDQRKLFDRVVAAYAELGAAKGVSTIRA